MRDLPPPSPPSRWDDHLKNGFPVASSRPTIGADSKVLAMGSCFALEIRSVLVDRKIAVYPTMAEEEARQMIWYTPMSILQEVRLAFGLLRRNPLDVWDHGRTPDSPKRAKRFQDPYRRLIYADTREELETLVARQDASLREGFERATDFVFTLGLIEAWKLPTGNWACLEPYPLDPARASLDVLGFPEARDAIAEIVRILRERRPDASVTFTVSPIPLRMTFRPGIDVAVANSESKAVLRAALGQVCREQPSIHYFPSYERVTAMGAEAFKPDGRHVEPRVVASVVQGFLEPERARPSRASAKGLAIAGITALLWTAMFWATARLIPAERSSWIGRLGPLWLAYLAVAFDAARYLVDKKRSWWWKLRH